MHNEAMIAVVDNDESLRMALDTLLRSSGYTVRTYVGPYEYLNSDGPLITSCLICDIQMPEMDGITMYEELATRGMHIPVIFITGNPCAQRRPGSQAMQPIAFFPKPFPIEKLLDCIKTVLERRH
jgi:FixJ family two-component response regulator